jgi:hypothetical protein
VARLVGARERATVYGLTAVDGRGRVADRTVTRALGWQPGKPLSICATGPLNRLGRDLGSRPPFRQKVRDVCDTCNHGWMSRLELVAKRALTPFILGIPGELGTGDLGQVAVWVHKTALTSLLMSSEQDRADGYGLPASEYHAVHDVRDTSTAPEGQFWIGRYSGSRLASVHVTPIAVRFDGTPEPDRPHGYTMTIVIGQLLIHGMRFTTPALAVPVDNGLGLPQMWPPAEPVRWPDGAVIDDLLFLDVAGAKMLRSAEPPIQVRPWTPATELPASQAIRNLVELPTICGRHAVYYPASLAVEAMWGRFVAFATACECDVAYLVQTEPDGAHCKSAGTAAVIAELYDDLPGEEQEIYSTDGVFFCKRVAADAA